jgi:hypothetical protein
MKTVSIELTQPEVNTLRNLTVVNLYELKGYLNKVGEDCLVEELERILNSSSTKLEQGALRF